jgi:hypothetical protein
MNRRVFLRSLGIAGLGLGAASTWRLESNHVLRVGDGPAYAPWADWQRTGTKPLEQLVRAAVLASNPHNTQPWKFHLLPNGIDVFADTSRRLGAMDPLLREMHIGVGCAVENLLLAAEAVGYRWRFDEPESSEDGELQPIVRVLLDEGAMRPSSLYAAIPRRHTNRGRYFAGKPVDARTLKALDGVNNSDSELRVFWFRNAQEKQAFGNLVVRATGAIIADREQSSSSTRWMRANWSDIQRFRDGLTYDAQGLTAGIRAMAKFLPPLSVKQTDRFWLSATRETHVATADLFGLIAIRDAKNTLQRVEAGRLWQRMHLLATLQGIAMHPLNQPVERRDRELQLGQAPTYARALSELQQDDRWQAVMLFRLGYPTQDALPSPRRAIAEVLI